MTTPANNSKKWISVASALLLVAAFFIPWVNWEGSALSGMNLPDGKFFATSEDKFGQANPFPQFDFAMKAFWLVPVLGFGVLALSLSNKRSFIVAALAGVLALSQVAVYTCFTDLLVNKLGYVKSFSGAINIGIYATVIAALGIIIAAVPAKAWVKLLLIIIGPAATWGGFQLASNYLENKTHDDTASVKSAYTITATALIDEFKANDTLASKKYADQFVTVEQAKISEVKVASDSSATIEVKNDAGDYIIFAFEGEAVKGVKEVKTGDIVTIKGSCSGGGLSILDVITIEFKRSIINKQ
ncbi:MAG TPA: hypothetical protein VHM26_10275 [Chitinophagaceae bacterium]|jgi:hypothetical protein|nr:hypothetical protein [Chitinophagaceae bacterium]